VRTLALLSLALLAGCSSSSSGQDGGIADASREGASNHCITYGQKFGYVCQSGPSCAVGYSNVEDYPCGNGELCCAPPSDGGLVGSGDASVFVDGAVFETGVADSGHDGGHAPSQDGGHDGGHDAARASDSGTDATHHDSGHPANDAAADAGHPAADSGSSDARHG
jgi:hypothetical protein